VVVDGRGGGRTVDGGQQAVNARATARTPRRARTRAPFPLTTLLSIHPFFLKKKKKQMGNQHFAVRARVDTLAQAATAYGSGEALAPGTLVLRFQHPAPIQPGPLGGIGWREEEAAARAEAGAAAAAAPGAAAPAASAAPPAGARRITPAELAAHADEKAAWFAYRGRVYDATGFLDDHPGGAESILISAGADATADFDAIHSARAKAMLDEYYVGELVEEEEESGEKGGGRAHGKASAATAALDPRARTAFPLLAKTVLSPDSRLFRFGLPADRTLGLPCGKHVFMYGTPPGGGEIARAYTPISRPDDEFLDLVVKVYDDKLGGGKMSRWLDGLALGDTVPVKGPVGHFEWVGRGAATLHRKPLTGLRRLTFVAAGTGITPCFAVLRALVEEEEGADTTTAVLIYGNRHEDGVLLADELDGLAARSGGRLRIVYTLSRPGPAWPHARGRIDAGLLAAHAFPAGEAALALTCGPPALVEDVVKPALAEMGYAEGRVVVF
jgi:nitrate reductase (NAD(P)H)